jgi:hypothetical protein
MGERAVESNPKGSCTAPLGGVGDRPVMMGQYSIQVGSSAAEGGVCPSGESGIRHGSGQDVRAECQ